MIHLRSSPYRELRILTCKFRREHLIVYGTVPTFYMKQMAQESVRPLAGVEKITNRVSVQSKTTDFGRSQSTLDRVNCESSEVRFFRISSSSPQSNSVHR
jgi:hypothetical protein